MGVLWRGFLALGWLIVAGVLAAVSLVALLRHGSVGSATAFALLALGALGAASERRRSNKRRQHGRR